MPRRLLAILGLTLTLAGACLAPAHAGELDDRLAEIAALPAAQNAERVQQLLALKPAPGSAQELERLYLLAGSGEHAPPVTAETWSAWQQAAARNGLSHLAPLAQSLLQVVKQLRGSRYTEALEALKQLPALQPSDPPLWRYRALALRADVVEESGDPEAALLLRLEAAQLADEIGQVWRQVDALRSLSFTHARLGQLQRAVQVAEDALARAQRLPDAALLSGAYHQVAMATCRAQQLSACQRNTEQAVAQARIAKDPRLLAFALANASDTYLQLHDNGRALRLAEEAYALGLQLKAENTQSLALHNGGIAKIHLGRVAEGTRDVRRSLTLELQGGSIASAADGYRELGEALEHANELRGAWEAYAEHRRLTEEASRVDRRKAMAEAQERFDESQRARETERLKQRTALQAEQIRTQRLQYGLAALVLAVGALLLALIWLLYRRLRTSNRLLAATNRDLAAQSEVDALTGLGNRRRFLRLLKHHEPGGVLRAGLLLLDVDHFKRINDEHGHAAGDTVLQALAGRLRSAVREPEGVMRWGGEEFLLMLPGADPALVHAMAQRLLTEIGGTPVALRDGRTLRVTVSIGGLALPLRDLQPGGERAVDLTDALMYRAKTSGRNQAWLLEDAQVGSVEAALAALAAGEAAHGPLTLNRLAGPGGPL